MPQIDYKLLGKAQLALALIGTRRTGTVQQIWQPDDKVEHRAVIDYIRHLVNVAQLNYEYGSALNRILEQNPGISVNELGLAAHCKAALSAVASTKPSRHVIFLGAGASASAGLPLAPRLAHLIKNAKDLRHEFKTALINSGVEPQAAEQRCTETLDRIRDIVSPAVQLFRDSGYPTIDQFGREARNGKLHMAAQQLKRLVRLILALPSLEACESSDYNSFTQKLFGSDNRLRSDVTIITFNYDVVLQALLTSRLCARNQIREVYSANEFSHHRTAISGGLGGWPERSWTKCSFSVLPLHGQIAYPFSQYQGNTLVFGKVRHDQLFSEERVDSLIALAAMEGEPPPIAFPFELFGESGETVKEGEFALNQPGPHGDQNLHGYFSLIWSHARAAVRTADRISFVGLSLHEYLIPGLRYLLSEVSGPIQLVIANPESTSPNHAGPNRLVNDMRQLIATASRGNATIIKSSSEAPADEECLKPDGPTLYGSFADMIRREL